MSGSLTWQPGLFAFLAVAAAALAGAEAVVAYRRIRRVRFRRWMLLVRLAALTLLATAAFAPSLDVGLAAGRKRQVLVVVDDSRSMAEIDPRPDGQQLRVAEALGLVERAAWAGDDFLERARTLPKQMSAVEAARARRDQVRLAAQPIEAEQKQLDQVFAALKKTVDDLKATANHDEPLRFAAPPLDKIAGVLGEPNAALPAAAVDDLLRETERRQRAADGQRAGQDPSAKAAVRSVSGQSRYALARAAADRLAGALTANASATFATIDGSVVAALPAEARRDASPITAGIAAAVDHIGAADCEALLLLSDGRSTEPRPGLTPALLSAAIPIYPIEIAAANNAPDVRIARLAAPPTALTGEAVPVRVTLQHRGAGGSQVQVILSDGKTVQRRSVTLSDGPFDADFTCVAAAAGLQLKASVEPLPGELREENNAADAAVKVVDRKVRVTLVSGSAGWDLQYLRNALARSPWVILQQQILAAGEPCRFSPAELGASDVLVLCDVPPSALSAEQCDAMTADVARQGKSVLLLPGDGDWLGVLAGQPALSGLAPQRIGERPAWRLPPSEAPTIQPLPAATAEVLPAFRLDDSPAASAARWLARPQFFRRLDVGELKPQVRALLVDRATQAPLIVEHAVGGGRAMAVLSDELWRWRRETGAEAADRFWLDLVRELIDPPPASVSGDLSLGVERDPVRAGQPVLVRARVPAAAAKDAKLSLVQDGHVVQTISPNELLPGSGRLGGTFTPQTAGKFEIILSAGGGEVRLAVTVADSSGDELADTSPDLPLLTRMAQQTGGVVTPLEDLEALSPQLALRRTERIDTIHVELWSSPYWFAAIVACLGLEWALRKIGGLV